MYHYLQTVKMRFLLIPTALFLCPRIQASLWLDTNAVIAVVAYHYPIRDKGNSEDLVNANAEAYIRLLEESQNVDLIVFPEMTLRNDDVTAVELRVINIDTPCDSGNFPGFFKKLSCAARDSKTYVVVNLVEKAACDDSEQGNRCKTDGYFYYNTDVVFDRNGTVVNRYRKYHLFGEDHLDKPRQPDPVVLTTDFGKRFGIFTCFDLLFKHPAEDFVDHVDAILFPTMWHSELPFLTALQAQQMWSHTHDTPLFSAGANNGAEGSGGTGIYNGASGTILADIAGFNASKIYVYNNSDDSVTTKSTSPNTEYLPGEMDSFFLNTDVSITDYTSTALNTSTQTFATRVCHEGAITTMCCDFKGKIALSQKSDGKDEYTYLLVAYSGVRSSSADNGGTEVCGVIACLNSSISSCGRRFPKYSNIDWTVNFLEISITADFMKSDNKTQYPNSLLSSIRPINPQDTTWTENALKGNETEYVRRTYTLRKPQDQLLTFAIYGRDFSWDSPPQLEHGSGWGNHIAFSWQLLVIATILGIFETE